MVQGLKVKGLRGQGLGAHMLPTLFSVYDHGEIQTEGIKRIFLVRYVRVFGEGRHSGSRMQVCRVWGCKTLGCTGFECRIRSKRILGMQELGV